MGLKADIENFFKSNPLGEALEADAKAAWNELKSIGKSELQTIATNAATAALSVQSKGGSPGAALDASITSLKTGITAAGKTVAAATLATFATSINNQVAAMSTPAAT